MIIRKCRSRGADATFSQDLDAPSQTFCYASAAYGCPRNSRCAFTLETFRWLVDDIGLTAGPNLLQALRLLCSTQFPKSQRPMPLQFGTQVQKMRPQMGILGTATGSVNPLATSVTEVFRRAKEPNAIRCRAGAKQLSTGVRQTPCQPPIAAG